MQSTTTEVIEITICVRFDCDTTTTNNLHRCSFFALVESRRMEAGARDTSQSDRSRIAVESNAYRNFDHCRRIVECVVVSSYRSRIVVESQL